MTLLSHRRQISAGHQDPLTTLLRSMATVSFISSSLLIHAYYLRLFSCSLTFFPPSGTYVPSLYPYTLYSPDFTRPPFVPYYYIETYVSYNIMAS